MLNKVKLIIVQVVAEITENPGIVVHLEGILCMSHDMEKDIIHHHQ